jgi:hypothetical protein
MADQGNDLGVENLDLKKRQHPCLFFLAISGTCCWFTKWQKQS